MAEHTNRLIHESSPYLRQHAHNPVDWFPWGEEALAKAKAENKPILLSIGYSACHWCHVMERESFENDGIARLMNEHFVNIKVDREERPDLDHIYMSAVQMMTGQGGWPLTVFLTPEGKPFFGGTYFPPEDRYGRPGFPRLLQGIAHAYQHKQDEVQSSIGQLMQALQRADALKPESELPAPEALAEAAAKLARAYDAQHGGIGQAPKFPNTSVLEVFLRHQHSSGDTSYRDMVLHTLRRMAHGGIYDQLGGGFHRYSVDERWLVPHFEKMLYDNAQLVPLYLASYQVTGDLFFATIARETLDYVLREMRHPEGGFYSTQDADSEGHEGKYFVWDEKEVREILGDEVAEIVCRYWDVTDVGNFENHNILHVTLEIEQIAKMFGRELGALRLMLGEARAKLAAARSRRVKPDRDEKILTAWNGLMISAFARAAELFGEDSDRDAAVQGVEFVRRHLLKADRLLSTFKDGTARLNAYLDDYAFFVAALLDVFEAVQQRQYLDQAVQLTDSMLAHFWDESAGGLFFTSDDHEELIVRTKPSFDGSIPSGNSVAAMNLLRLYHYTGETKYLGHAEAIFRLFAVPMQQQPFAFANLWCAFDFYANHPREIVVVGVPSTSEVKLLLEQIHRLYLPNRTVIVADPRDQSLVPELVRGKGQVDAKATVYVCRNMSCSLPVTAWKDLEPLLV